MALPWLIFFNLRPARPTFSENAHGRSFPDCCVADGSSCDGSRPDCSLLAFVFSVCLLTIGQGSELRCIEGVWIDELTNCLDANEKQTT
jgi:hypothetical protein